MDEPPFLTGALPPAGPWAPIHVCPPPLPPLADAVLQAAVLWYLATLAPADRAQLDEAEQALCARVRTFLGVA